MNRFSKTVKQAPKLNKYDYLVLFIIEALALGIMAFLILYTHHLGSVYATTSDIVLQHIPLADNLRQLFYQTHQLIPQFIPNLGGGQNAFYFTYHGLANPLVILTYFLPFLSMYHCWLLIMTLIILATVGLTYRWLRFRFSWNWAGAGTLIMLLTMPLLLHTHYHYMFIDYMPWLLLALIGVDKALYKHKYILLIISLTLISLTSYYYLPTCILAIGIYSTFVYFEKNDLKINVKQLGKDISRILISLLLGILLAAFCLLPTAFTIIQSSASRQYNINLIELLIPNFNIISNGYSINISILALIIVTTLIFSKSKKYFITTVLFLASILFPIFEIFASTSSTGLPIKALIPLLPIFCLLAISSLRFIE
ncbi:MAG: YfhO family protein, partial [Bifidobacteriaceae bacterium]|nr:YfhO family protein [Bifidobacteriaceae bacterium]